MFKESFVFSSRGEYFYQFTLKIISDLSFLLSWDLLTAFLSLVANRSLLIYCIVYELKSVFPNKYI